MRILIMLILAAAAHAQTLPNAVPMPTPEIQYLDSTGQPLSGAKLCTYAANSSTPLATYTDSTAGTSNTNPIILDTYGRASVWIGPRIYKFVLRVGGDATCNTGAVQWTQDNVADTTLYFVNYVKTIGSANLLTYTAPWTGAVTRTAASKFSDVMSVKDFGCYGDDTHDDTACIQQAVDDLQANTPNNLLTFPTGIYKTSSPIVISGSLEIEGSGSTSLQGSFIHYTGSSDAVQINVGAGSKIFAVNFRHFGVLGNNTNSRYGFNINFLSQAYFTDVSVNDTSANSFVEPFHVTDSDIVFFTQIVATCKPSQASTSNAFHLDNVAASSSVSEIHIQDANLYQCGNVFWLEGSVNHLNIAKVHAEQWNNVFYIDSTNTPEFSGHPAINLTGVYVHNSYFLASNYSDFSNAPRLINGIGVGSKYFQIVGFRFTDNTSFFVTPSPSYPFFFTVDASATMPVGDDFTIANNIYGQVTGGLVSSDNALINFSLSNNKDSFLGTPPRTIDFNCAVNAWALYGVTGAVGIGPNNFAPTYTADIYNNCGGGAVSTAAVRLAASQTNASPAYIVRNHANSATLTSLTSDAIDNSFIGVGAGLANTPGGGGAGHLNTFVGQDAAIANTVGQANTAVGGLTMFVATTGSFNAAYGVNALASLTTGSSNTALGYNAGWTQGGNGLTTGTNNTFVGQDASFSGASQWTNSAMLGYQAHASQSNEVVLGNNSVKRIALGGEQCNIYIGSGTPVGNQSGFVCDLYLRTNGGAGTTLYVKESGAGTTAGWVGK